jgi:hypothetical protein
VEGKGRHGGLEAAWPVEDMGRHGKTTDDMGKDGKAWEGMGRHVR